MLAFFMPNSSVTVEGGSCQNMFVIKSGSFVVKVGGEVVRYLGVGDVFAVTASLHQTSSTSTVTAVTNGVVFSLRLKQVLEVLHLQDLYQAEIFFALEKIPQLKHFQPEDLKCFVDLMFVKELLPGDDPIKDMPDLLCFLVVQGSVLVRGAGCDADGTLVKQAYSFGFENWNVGKPFVHTIENTTKEKCILALLMAESVKTFETTTVSDARSQAKRTALIRKTDLFRHLSEYKCRLLEKHFRMITKRHGECIIREGEVGEQFFVVQSGELAVTKRGHTIRTLGKLDYFGENAILHGTPRPATVTCATQEAELLVIDKPIFLRILESHMLETFAKRNALRIQRLNFDDLIVEQILGRGTTSVVKMVKHKKTKQIYALKCINRDAIKERRQQEHLLLEREVLLENNHPFIVQAMCTMKDQQCVYFCTEYVCGGELYDVIRMLGLLTKPQAQFYTGSLLLALECLHNRSICYRDLKPENVLIDACGYIKLIDFGCAVKLRGIVFTLIGTPHYMAPEVVMGDGYGLSCDVWSLGVCLHEFLFGPVPFGNSTQDPHPIFIETLTANLTFPPHMDPPSVAIVKGLLQRRVERRLGCSGCSSVNWEAVKTHPFFYDFSFEKLWSKSLEAPYVPKTETFVGDTSLDELSDSALSSDHSDDDDRPDEDCDDDGWDKVF